MDEKEYFTIRLDLMADLVKELSNDPELTEVLGEPLSEKIFFVGAENDIVLIPSPELGLSDEQRKTVEGLFAKSFEKVLASMRA